MSKRIAVLKSDNDITYRLFVNNFTIHFQWILQDKPPFNDIRLLARKAPVIAKLSGSR